MLDKGTKNSVQYTLFSDGSGIAYALEHSVSITHIVFAVPIYQIFTESRCGVTICSMLR